MLETDCFSSGINPFGARVRSGELNFEEATRACLSRIAQLEPHLQAFEIVDDVRALNAAKSLDQLLASGTDLGPLMGVCVAVKDIIAVDGLPTTNGSLYTSDHLTTDEGTLIKRLRAAGCVIIGKTKTVEFALGATGINEARGTPWNPWDVTQHRIPGGSSSGSAVAVAAGLCGFALGTDTGGSVRIPACYNGITGHKTTVGLWPTDGVFPLSATFDSIGPLCRNVEDASVIHSVVTGQEVQIETSLQGMRFGKPRDVFFDDLDTEVAAGFDKALNKLQSAGVQIIEFDLPEATERETLFPLIVGAEIISALTPEGFTQARPKMDTVTQSRAALGLDSHAHEYVTAKKRLSELEQIAANKFTGLDAWVSPTCPMLPVTIQDIENTEAVAKRALLSSRNTQIGNLLKLCAVSIPIPTSAGLPIGFQLMLPAGQDSRLLAVCSTLAHIIGTKETADLNRFIDS